jgi:hypothetical protein
MLKKLQQKLLGYTRISSKRSMLFYIAMLFNVAALVHFIIMSMDVITSFHTIVGIVGMVIGVLMILLFDINSMKSVIFFVIMSIAPGFFFPLFMNMFPEPPMSYVMYIVSSVLFLLMELLGLLLTADIYDSSEGMK